MAAPRPSRRAGLRASCTSRLAAAVLAAACASNPAPVAPPPAGTEPAPACIVATDSVGPPRVVTAVFADSGDAERARLAGSMQTPVRFDCEGRARVALASAWSPDSSRRFWTIRLDATAGAADEPGWTAPALAAAWRADSAAAAALRLSGVESLLPLDDHRLTLAFSAPRPVLPPLMADPALGVRRPASPPTVLVIRPPGPDLRDALDGGADLVVSADPALLDYAAHRPNLTAVPLPWNRSYVLLMPQGSSLSSVVSPDSAAFRTGLARDAVRAEARAMVPPFWWEEAGECERLPAPPAARRSEAIAYATDDATARELAERLVALAGPDGPTARGLSATGLAAALRAGTERAYVVGVSSHPLVRCRTLADWPADLDAVGLVETRARAILRKGTPLLVVDWDGTLRAPESAATAPASP